MAYHIHSTKTRRGTSDYLEKIMNARMLKFFQGYVIARCHVLINYSIFKPFPSQVLIFQKVHRDPLGRLRRGGSSGLGRSDFNGNGQVKIKNWDRLLEGGKTRLDNPRPGRPMLRLLLSTTGKVSQVQHLG